MPVAPEDRKTKAAAPKAKAKPEPKAVPAPTDWLAVLGLYGMTPQMQSQIATIWKTTGGVSATATPLIMSFVRGTPWYRQQFPGITAGMQKGLFNDERGYQAYKNEIDQTYRQYYGRPATAAEVGAYAQAGKDVAAVTRQFQSGAIGGTLSDPLKALFTKPELKSITDQAAGIYTEAGFRLQAEANLAANVASLYQEFMGRPPTRAELVGYVKAGQTADDVAKQFATQANINAMNPAISHLFTPEEIRQIALEKAGGVTAGGQGLIEEAKLAADLNPLYHQYTGAGVSRADIQAARAQGIDATRVAQQFAGKAYVDANRTDIQQAAGNFGDGQLTEEQLKALGEEKAGYDTPMGQALQVALEKAQRRMQGVFRGVLANPALSMLGGKPAANQKRPDVGA